jgi:hypothetical protein
MSDDEVKFARIKPSMAECGLVYRAPGDNDGAGSIEFIVGGAVTMRFEPDGRVIVRGEEVAKNSDVFERFKEWLNIVEAESKST